MRGRGEGTGYQEVHCRDFNVSHRRTDPDLKLLFDWLMKIARK